MQNQLSRNRIVLLGIGHTNAHVLRMWKMNPLPDTELICISNFPVATYSGMLPGVLAGQYPASEMELDLVRLSHSAGARLIIDEVRGLDHARRRLEFSDRTSLEFDWLSIGVGSLPSFRDVTVHSDRNLVTIKPMQTFLTRIEQHLHRLFDSQAPGQFPKIVIVGGGVGSIEIAFCLDARLRSRKMPSELSLLTASSRVGHQLQESTQKKVERALKQRAIHQVTGRRVREIHADYLLLDDETRISGDCFIWATQAAPPQVLSCLGIEVDASGFLAVRPTLQTLSHDHIFSVGDTSTIISHPNPKAGVYAVRQGPVLWENLKRSVAGQPLEEYHPQSGFLKLINTGEGKSIAEYKGFSSHSGLAWKLKNRIDSKFMAMYRNYDVPRMAAPIASDSIPRCLGCGGKIGSHILGEVLRELALPAHPDVILGLEQPDDAAVIKTYNQQVTVTTDFFASPFQDPDLVGRIAVLNSASDCFVMGAQPTAALAMIQLPHGHPRGQARLMRELMSGSVREITRMGAALIGGHSIEGPELTVGFTFLGRQLPDLPPRVKAGLKVGDQLILSKALGTGVLLAALMRNELPGLALQPLLDSMLRSNQIALTLIQQGLVTAITDVTGFGLAGHVSEMLTASQKSARLFLDQIPRLPQVDEMLGQGIESTLAPDNRILRDVLFNGKLNDPRQAILFDPQTSGGLLFGVAPEKSALALELLHADGFVSAAIIGEVLNESPLPVTLDLR